MGMKIAKVSMLTWRSLLSLYGKAIALVFAVYCSVSGMAPEPVRPVPFIKGRAFMKADSAVLRNVKIFMGSITCPVYGVGIPCNFIPADSMVTDSLGYFQTSYPHALFNGGSGVITFVKIDSTSGNSRFRHISATPEYFFNSFSDTVVNLYLEQLVFTGVSQKVTNNKPALPVIKTIRGNIVSIKIGNWSAPKSYSARIVNIAGKLVATPEISTEGILTWNTADFPDGVYFVNVKTGSGIINAKVAVK